MSGLSGGSGGLGVMSRSASAAAVAGNYGGLWGIPGSIGAGTSFFARANDPSGDLHHIATDKNRISGNQWTSKFDDLFNNADISISAEDANIVRITNHKGSHNDAYHQIIYDRLSRSVQQFQPHTPQYREALIETLDAIRADLLTPNHPLRGMIIK